jgi:hypothetical protein
MSSPITSITLKNYKGFRLYSLQLRDINFLVGPNNCGKSTIIGGLRILDAGLRRARSRNPERLLVSGEPTKGYEIDLEDLDVSTENVHTDYNDLESSIEFRLANGNLLNLVFPAKGGCFLIPESGRVVISSPSGFGKHFDIPLVVVPVLGPLEHNEAFVKPTTVQRNLRSSRASRNFRSYWAYHKEEFAAFSNLVSSTWAGMSIEEPELNGDIVQMYYLENRMTREMYWAGFGFQIWAQLLSHLSRAQPGALVVIDEPEVYLHPDVQRQIPTILDQLQLTSVIATHSTEIISQAEASEILAIDKAGRSAKRLREVKEVQLILDQIGSVQNLTLSRLARHGRVLFFEGEDLMFFRRFASRMGIKLGSDADLSVIHAGGFQSWRRIRDLAWGLKNISLKMRIGAILDRDFFPDEELSEIKKALAGEIEFLHIMERKEIENYLLVPPVLQRLIHNLLQKKGGAESLDPDWAANTLNEVSEAFRHEALGQYTAKAILYSHGSGIDPSKIIASVSESFHLRWAKLSTRLCAAPGKEVLKKFRRLTQEKFGLTLTDASIIGAFRADEIPSDLQALLGVMEKFTGQANPATT